METNYFLQHPVDRCKNIRCCSLGCGNKIHLGGREQHRHHRHLVAKNHHLNSTEKNIVLWIGHHCKLLIASLPVATDRLQ